ncbi:MAG: O-antigen ligase family protein [Acidobacteriales bacterium]|nr:O-antigen ligase family protein [Terriglobales bacterium]
MNAIPQALESEVISAPAVSDFSTRRMKGSRLAYGGVLLFTFAYFFRPEDWTSLARFMPLALLGGGISILGFVIAFMQNGGLVRSQEAKILLALLGWFVILVPTSHWPGGTFAVLSESIWKIVVVTIIMTNVVDTMTRLRRLLIIQSFAMLLLAWVSRDSFDAGTGRLEGASRAFGNSNDLAIMIAVTIPIVLYLVISSSNYLLKALWLGAISVMVYVIVLTLSRAGFLSLVVAMAVLTWQYGVRGKKFGITLTAAALVLGTFAIVAPGTYGRRVASIFIGALDEDGLDRDARGSRGTRIELMKRSVEETLSHPVFGVGPGQFQEFSGSWHVSHNIFLQFSSECGIPGLAIFLALLWRTRKNLIESDRVFTTLFSKEWLLAGALRASFWSLMVGALFANFGYVFFPYMVFAFIACLNQMSRLALGEQAEATPAEAPAAG